MKSKNEVIEEVKTLLNSRLVRYTKIDDSRPWGGFFVIEESDSNLFVESFFKDLDKGVLGQGKISPKILLVEPQKKLSWQYHHRRSEAWKLISGKALVIKSLDDEQTPPQSMVMNEVLILQQGERHRLVGSDEWGMIAEIWIHTNPDNPSNEEDIVRLEDDFGR